ncbi:MAG TPA: hypothetical protein PL169_27975, partial [Leptospiraceae bacterium]|nr:hypothetical protein [Leptospiraceae bacterium]
YLARATVFNGEIIIQGLGTEAEKYSGEIRGAGKDAELILRYDGLDAGQYPIIKKNYTVRKWKKPAKLEILED